MSVSVSDVRVSTAFSVLVFTVRERLTLLNEESISRSSQPFSLLYVTTIL